MDCNSINLETYDTHHMYSMQIINGHTKDTEIVMSDGNLKKIQDIKIGEYLMGVESKPILINNILNGYDNMYKIKPNTYYLNDDSSDYIVNSYYTLSLVYSFKKSIKEYNNNYYVFWFDNIHIKELSKMFTFDDFNKNKIYKIALKFLHSINEKKKIDITIYDYLQLPKTLQSKFQTITSMIYYPQKPTIYDPYTVGFMEGINIYGMVEKNKVTKLYKYNSIDVRLHYIAGFIDSYGYTFNDKYFIDIYEYNSYVIDLVFMIRSVGLNCNYSDNKLTIYGKHILKIPTKKIKINYKILYDIPSVIYIEKVMHPVYDKYYGFELFNNEKYILGNCIISDSCKK